MRSNRDRNQRSCHVSGGDQCPCNGEFSDKLDGMLDQRSEEKCKKKCSMKEGHSPTEHHRSSLSRLRSSIDAKLRRSFHHTYHSTQGEESLGELDNDTVSLTLDTTDSVDSDNSSCFNAEEGKELDTFQHDFDGYESDRAICEPDSFDSTNAKKSKKKHNHRCRHKKQTIDPLVEPIVQQIEQLLQEQTIALEAWDEVATEYQGRIEPFTSLFVPHLLDANYLNINSSSLDMSKNDKYLAGKSVLDVATGTGTGALYAASKGASSVMATDFSENMIQILQSRIVDFSNVNNTDTMFETTVCNGLCLPLTWTNKYDIVCSNFGVIYFQKIKEGILEMVRCTVPGGHVCISGWGSREETPAHQIFPEAMKLCGLDRKWYHAQSTARKQLLAMAGTVPLSKKNSGGLCSRSKRKKKYHGISLTPNYFCPATRVSSSQYFLHSIMVEVGLTDVKVMPVTEYLRLDGVESYWQRYVLASPNLKRFVELCLSPEDVLTLKEAVSYVLSDHCVHDDGLLGDEIVLKATAYIAVGTTFVL